MTTVGILGDGQLARMLSLAAYPLGMRTLCFGSDAQHAAGFVTQVQVADANNIQDIARFIEQVDVVTLETENIPLAFAKNIAAVKPLYPNVEVLAVAQDRLQEKKHFRQSNIPTADFFEINTLAELQNAVKQLGYPAVLKTRFHGYDGKGQVVINCAGDVTQAWQQLGEQALILEGFVPFEMEVSMLAARNVRGDMVFYPLTHNEHENGILRSSQAPYKHSLAEQAQQYAQDLMQHFDYVGVLAIEFFIYNGTLIANEMAPRVHNSGHWTIEGAVTSQFEQHVRAVAGLPLGDASARGYTLMRNCLGSMPDKNKVLAVAGAHYHDYQKAPRSGRKVGHVTCTGSTQQACLAAMQQINFA